MTVAEMLPQFDRCGFEAAKMLLGVLWQSTLLMAAVAVLSWLLRRRRASLRHALWTAAIVVAPLLPFLGSILSHSGAPQAQVALLPRYEAPAAVIDIEPEPVGTLAAVAPPVAPKQAIQTTTASPSAPRSRSMAEYPWALGLLGYCAGMLALLAWVVIGRLQIARWIRNGRPVCDKHVIGAFECAGEVLPTSRRLGLMESDMTRAPFTVGAWHPVVVLPTHFAEGLSDEDLYAVALHETAHVRRRDPLTFSLVVLVRAALFFHPLVWLAVRRVSLYAEQAADDAVLETTGQPSSYAKTLARIAESIRRRAITAEVAVGIVFTRGAFLSRVEAILSDRRDRIRRLSTPALGAILAAAALSLTTALLLPIAESDGKPAGVPALESTGSVASGAQTAAAGAAPAGQISRTYDFANAVDCEKWVDVGGAPGVEFSGGVARMSAPEGRSFMLNMAVQEDDLAVEVTAANESGPALTWIVLRWRNLDNFYEAVLKGDRVEVWHKCDGRYNPILRSLPVQLDHPESVHAFKAQIEGQPPVVALWLDRKLLWSGKEETGLPPTGGRRLALETEFSTVAVHSVTVSEPIPVPLSAPETGDASAPVSSTSLQPEAPAVESTAPRGAIQTLIDEAASGSVVHIPAGTYDECVSITKPVTLKGDGWEKTTIRQLAADEPLDASAQLDRRLRSASSSAERVRLSSEFRDRYRRPAILVSETGPVSISGIKVIGCSGGDKDRLFDDTAIELRGSQVEISQCAVLRSRGCGIMVLDGSKAKIQGCLVAAAWNTGIVVASRSGAATSAEIVDCDVRNCYSRCIVVGRGCDSTVIRRCRISGSAWHGIRYDSASPTIEDCLIFGNARFGIYAAGRTAAKVTRNILSGNEMAGMWCLQGNRDTVEDNAFTGNKREALDIMEPSRPVISRNVFSGSPVAIQIGLDSRNPSPKSDEPLRIEGNEFRDNKAGITRVTWKEGSQEAAVENLKIADFPGNVETGVSAASTDTAGALAGREIPVPVDTKSPWPRQAEESAIIPDSDTRDYQQWKLP